MCSIQCTQEEICNVLDVTDKTLTRWCKKTYGESFSEVYEKKRDGGRVSLRRMQWTAAEKNPTLLIWLGKQMLKQRDKFEDEEQNETTLTLTNEQALQIREIAKNAAAKNN